MIRGRMTDIAISCEGLVKRYGDVVAVDGLRFRSGPGSASACSDPTARGRPRPSRSSKG